MGLMSLLSLLFMIRIGNDKIEKKYNDYFYFTAFFALRTRSIYFVVLYFNSDKMNVRNNGSQTDVSAE